MYFTTAEAARGLNISESSVRKLIERKQLSARKFPPDALPRGAISVFDPDDAERLKGERHERREPARRAKAKHAVLDPSNGCL